MKKQNSDIGFNFFHICTPYLSQLIIVSLIKFSRQFYYRCKALYYNVLHKKSLTHIFLLNSDVGKECAYINKKQQVIGCRLKAFQSIGGLLPFGFSLDYGNMNIYAIFPLISCLLLFIGSLYLARKKSAIVPYRLFAISCFALFLVELGNFMSLISKDIVTALFWQRWVLACMLFLPVCWTSLSLVFAREGGQITIKKRGWYLVLLSGLTLWFLAFLPQWSLINDVRVLTVGYGFVLGPIGRYLLIFLMLSLVVVLLNFENTYRSSQDKQRQRIKFAIRGMGLFLGSYIILSSLALLFSYIDTRFTVFGSIAIILGFLLVSYSIFKYGLADTRVYVGRQAIYTSATLGIVGAYLIIVGLIAKLFMKMGFSLTTFVSFLAAFFVFFLFISIIFSRSLKQRISHFIDRSFYKDKYDYRREWSNLSERLGTIPNENELIVEVKKTVKQVLHVGSVELVLDKYSTELMQWLLRYGEPISIKEFFRRQPEMYVRNKKFLEGLGTDILVSLNAKQTLLGFMAVGKKEGRKAFSKEDMELLKIISRQVSISILNARLSEELIISQGLENFHKVSSFLIHDLKNFVSMLSMVVQNTANNFDKPEFRKDSLDTISGTIAKMNRLMHRLSAVPKKLELKTKPMDINVLIEEAIKKLKIDNVPEIKLFRLFNYVPQLNVDAEYFQKVVLNLFLNALEAMPNGGNITVKTSYDGGIKDVGRADESYVRIMVSDTGCGMPREFIQQRLFKPFQSNKRKGMGIGLYQCKAIVEAHGGQILVESEESKGTTFTVKLPVNGNRIS